MSKESDAIRQEIAALEAELDERKKPTRQAQKTSGEDILTALHGLEKMVKSACGETYMGDEESMMGGPVVMMDDDMDDESACGYMDDDESEMYMDDESEMYMDDDLVDEPVVLDEEDDFDDFDDEPIDLEEEDIVYASETEPGIEDEITQDYLDDVLEEEKEPDNIVTDESMLDTAPTGYVARLKSASARLDRVADYLEKQGRKELALRIDKISDAIDARIKKEARDA
jgi:hypothetical protein